MVNDNIIIGTVTAKNTITGTLTAKSNIIGNVDIATANNYYEVSNEFNGTTIIID